MTKWDSRFIELARHFAGWSKDPSTKVGAVIVNEHHQVLGHGYNGFPRGIDDNEERLNDRPMKYAYIVHAELNAILNTWDCTMLRGAALYCTHMPCGECAKAIVQSGIASVYAPADSWMGRWKEGHEVATAMFKEAGVGVFVVPNI